jgi:hypothetical protein
MLNIHADRNCENDEISMSINSKSEEKMRVGQSAENSTFLKWQFGEI